jgi:hypothetical protein
LNISAWLAALAALLFATPAAAAQQPAATQAREEAVTVIHAGTLLAVPGQAPRRNVSVVVRGGRIAEVRSARASSTCPVRASSTFAPSSCCLA